MVWLYRHGTSIITIVLYIQYLAYRYQSDATVQYLYRNLGYKLDQLVYSSFPSAVHPFYQRVRSFGARLG